MKILLATNGSKHSALALHAAVDLSAKAGSELHVVHAWRALPPYSHPSVTVATDAEWYEQEAEKILLEQLDEIYARGGEVTGAYLRRGQPVEVICAVIEELGIDLAILGSRGLGLVERLVMGSVAERAERGPGHTGSPAGASRRLHRLVCRLPARVRAHGRNPASYRGRFALGPLAHPKSST